MASFLHCLRYDKFYKCSVAVEKVFSVTVHSGSVFGSNSISAICLCKGCAAAPSTSSGRASSRGGFLICSLCSDTALLVHQDSQQHKRCPLWSAFCLEVTASGVGGINWHLLTHTHARTCITPTRGHTQRTHYIGLKYLQGLFST
ncbi:hypothetical protein H1C71_008250 [Ictidomys tridecemlineatus]|nr:hypothetical protein H1C71_008250 [Ictidomys tridecemlineatus]